MMAILGRIMQGFDRTPIPKCAVSVGTAALEAQLDVITPLKGAAESPDLDPRQERADDGAARLVVSAARTNNTWTPPILATFIVRARRGDPAHGD